MVVNTTKIITCILLQKFFEFGGGESNKNNCLSVNQYGAYRFPVKRAAGIAIKEIAGFLKENSSIDQVFMVCFDNKTKDAYQEALAEIGESK